ncbi:MAG TPA: hypothetical protein VD704_02410 [Gaiellaceae bacterium]|nr:hypothetical protein [Gaiellaceae bacterium]
MARSERLTFEWDEQGLRLARRIVREKPAPRGDDLGKEPRPDGLWIEVRGSQGRVLYRRALRDAVPQHAEVFEPDGRIRAVPYAPETGVFTAVVPLERGAEAAVVVAGPEAELAQAGLRARPGEEGRRRELARVPLRKAEG